MAPGGDEALPGRLLIFDFACSLFSLISSNWDRSSAKANINTRAYKTLVNITSIQVKMITIMTIIQAEGYGEGVGNVRIKLKIIAIKPVHTMAQNTSVTRYIFLVESFIVPRSSRRLCQDLLVLSHIYSHRFLQFQQGYFDYLKIYPPYLFR